MLKNIYWFFALLFLGGGGGGIDDNIIHKVAHIRYTMTPIAPLPVKNSNYMPPLWSKLSTDTFFSLFLNIYKDHVKPIAKKLVSVGLGKFSVHIFFNIKINRCNAV